MSMVKPPSPDSEITWRPREIARGPDRRQPDAAATSGSSGWHPGTEGGVGIPQCGHGTFSQIISQTSRPLPSSTALAV
jgi:hypothetical protein